MSLRPSTILTGLISAAVCVCASAAQAAPQNHGTALSEWTVLSGAESPMQIAYPGNVFTEKPSPAVAEGRVFVSQDGRARLVVGTFTNEEAATLSSYRTQLLQDNYATADLDYAPVGKGWFVISGTVDGRMFYERVNFSCSGRIINTWAMIYPVSERKFYDRVVEAIAPTFRKTPGGCE